MSACSRTLIAWHLAILLTLPCAQSLAQIEQSREIEDLTREIIVKQSLRSDKQAEREDLRNRISTLQDEYERLQVQRVNLAERLQASRELYDKRAGSAAAQNAVRVDKAKDVVWSVVTSHQLKERSPLTMLLLQNDPLKVDRLYRYHKVFLSRLAIELAELDELVATQESLLREAEEAQNELTLVDSEFQANFEEIDTRKQRLALLTTALGSEISALDRDIDLLLRERESLKKVINEHVPVSGRNSPKPTPASRSDVSRWPVVGFISSRYGARRADGRIRTEGIVISASHREPITAVASGIVVFSQWLAGYGNTLIIDHGDEVISIYGHCDQLFKQASEPVEEGEVVASVGVGGELEEPGLYFEIRVRNQPTDPLSWLDRR